ncbi:MAG: hypothetical protein HFJ25_02865 [Clostridia bacterium]|nr:hypothetical protein [Clostridia bacterium]
MEDANQKKKMILYGIVATIAVFVVVLVLLVVLMAQESSKTKIIFDGKTYKTRTVEMTADDGSMYQQKNITYENKEVPILLNTSDGKTYYCIETLATMTGYKYNKGAYGELDENTNKCYIDNGGEYVTFSSEVESIYKNIKISDRYTDELEGKESLRNNNSIGGSSETEDEEVFFLEKPVIKFADGKLYASYDAITQGLNMSVIVNGSEVTIYTIEDLIASYTEFLNSKGYVLTKNFRNQRALCKGFAVAQKNGEYGVIELAGDGYQEVISVKYDTVEYVQSIGEFIISSNSMYGMIAPGEEKPTISLKYDSIQLLDAQKKLYIVENDKRFGVVDFRGDIIVPTEYDKIGLEDVSIYKSQGINSKYLLADNLIPVLQNNEYRLFSANGTLLSNAKFTSIGCAEPAKIINNTSAMPTLTVPLTKEITCLVYGQNNGLETRYGIMAIINNELKTVTSAYYEAIYYMNLSGKTVYYFDKRNSNNELLTLEELVNREAVKNFIINNSKNKPKDNKNDEKETAINNARIELQGALNEIISQYNSEPEFSEQPVTNFLTEGNLALFMKNYNISEVVREGELKVIFEDDKYKYEAEVTEELEILNIKVI